MTDIFTKEKRSWLMSRIRGKNTKIELQMDEILKGLGFPYQKYPKLHGNPDFILHEEKIVIFCDGDFWHGYKYHEKKRMPKKFWRDKIERNMERDIQVSRKLRYQGYAVLRFWEHDIEKRTEVCIDKIIRHILD